MQWNDFKSLVLLFVSSKNRPMAAFFLFFSFSALHEVTSSFVMLLEFFSSSFCSSHSSLLRLLCDVQNVPFFSSVLSWVSENAATFLIFPSLIMPFSIAFTSVLLSPDVLDNKSAMQLTSSRMNTTLKWYFANFKYCLGS